MKYVLLGSISPSWIGKQGERLKKSNEKLKQLIEINIFGGSSRRRPLGLVPVIILHYSKSNLDGFEPAF